MPSHLYTVFGKHRHQKNPVVIATVVAKQVVKCFSFVPPNIKEKSRTNHHEFKMLTDLLWSSEVVLY